MNYLNIIKAKVQTVGDKKKICEEDLTGPEMVKRLVQILMLNREVDVPIIEKIKADLLEWRE